MAANYTALNYDPTSNQLPFYNTQQQQQPSPTDSATATPHNISPTSPRMETYMKYQVPSHVRQLRPPKSPLYVPAALRPTERPVRQSPMTPPKSLHGSLDSLEQADFDGRTGADGAPPFDLVMQQGFFPDEDLGEVTGPPSKDHWKPDEAASSCDSPKCRSSFNLFVRKHHCRHCGHIFCAEHTAYTIPLDQNAKFHPEGMQSRACDSCYKQYRRWDTARSLCRKNSDNSDTGDSKHLSTHSLQMPAKPSEQVASSVPKDWAWSTF